MGRTFALIALLALTGFAQEGREEGAGRFARAAADAPRVFVRLRDAGRLEVKHGDAWKDATLDECAAALRQAVEHHDRERKSAGGSGFERVRDVEVTTLVLRVEAEPSVPWEHVQWLAVVAAEQRFRRIEFSDGIRTLLHLVPMDGGIEPNPPPEVLLAVEAAGRDLREAAWGDVKVRRPFRVVYRMDLRETEEAKAVVPWIREAVAEAAEDEDKPRVRCELRPEAKVPFGKVFDLMEALAGVTPPSVGFAITSLPNDDVRGAARLPYPG